MRVTLHNMQLTLALLPVLVILLNIQQMGRGSVQFQVITTVTLLSFQFMGYHTTMSVGELWGTHSIVLVHFGSYTRLLSQNYLTGLSITQGALNEQ